MTKIRKIIVVIAAMLVAAAVPSCAAGGGEGRLSEEFLSSRKDAKAYTDETARLDGLLNEHFSTAMNTLPQDEKKALRDAQRAWIDWRGKDAKFLALIPAASDFAREDDLGKMAGRVSFLESCGRGDAETDSGSLEGAALSAEYESALDSAASTGEAAGVTADEYARQDKLLNENYNALRRTLSKAQSDALKTAQLAWIKWRDADGALLGMLGVGSGAILMTETDRAGKAAYRAKFLASLIGLSGGGATAKPQTKTGGKSGDSIKPQDGAPLIRVTMTADDVNVRSEPSTKARSFGKVHKGDAFIAERQTVSVSGSDDWYKIIFPVNDISDGHLPRYIAARFARAEELADGDAERIAATAVGRNYDLGAAKADKAATQKKNSDKKGADKADKKPEAKASLREDDALVRLTVTADGVNVRSEPHTSGEPLTKAKSGDAFIAERWAFEDERGGKWYRIIFAADRITDEYEDRYISADFVSVGALNDDDRAAVAGTLYGRGGGDRRPLGTNDIDGFFDRAGNVFGRNIAEVVRNFGPGNVSTSWVDWFAVEMFEQDDLTVYFRPWGEASAAVSFTVLRKGFDVLGIVVGKTTQDEVRRMMGAPGSTNDSETIDGITGEFIGWHWEYEGGVADIYFSKETGKVAVIGLGWEI